MFINGPWYSGLALWYSGTLIPWYLGTLVPWYLGTLAPVHLATKVPWYLGTKVPRYLDTLVPWYLGTFYSRFELKSLRGSTLLALLSLFFVFMMKRQPFQFVETLLHTGCHWGLCCPWMLVLSCFELKLLRGSTLPALMSLFFMFKMKRQTIQFIETLIHTGCHWGLCCPWVSVLPLGVCIVLVLGRLHCPCAPILSLAVCLGCLSCPWVSV